jgi:NAD(P)-dependent dehydrogenase (short-subunit alcohol dehydrogenase family)
MTQAPASTPISATNVALTHTPQDSGVPRSARDFSVRDNVVIVTGSGQGIGRELARQYAAAGAKVVIADLNGGKADAVAAEIADAGGDSLAVAVDITDEVSVESMTDAVIERWGRIDTLVNNASIFAAIEKKPFAQIALAEWEQVMSVNVTGTFLCVRSVSRHMREAQSGRIINISSDAVPKGVPNYLHYVTSKSAIIGMTNSLARELGPDGIAVNCVRPGMVATEVDRTVNPTVEVRERAAALQCLPRGMVATDLVGVILFLSSPAAAFITGQTIACDGGYTHSS